MPGGNEVESLRKTEKIFLALATEVVAPKTTIAANTEPTKASPARRVRCATETYPYSKRAIGSVPTAADRFSFQRGIEPHESGALDSGALPIAAKFNGYRTKYTSINHA